MFGGQDDNMQPAPATGGAPDDTLHGVTDLVGGTAAPAPGPSDGGGFMPAPSEPAQASVPAPDQEAEDVVAEEPAPSAPEPPAADDAPSDSPSDAPADATSSSPVDEDLLDLKQQALQQLSPLLGHLDQTPEEKFRTTMMMIQATDNQALLKEAYEAAQNIGDEKVKAQALLDVVNEINYFSQQKPQD